MATAKIVMRKRPNKNGLHALTIRIIKDRKPAYVFLDQAIEAKYWDEDAQHVRKTHPNAARFNNYLLKKLQEANEKLLEKETTDESASSQVLKSTIKRKANEGFFKHANSHLENFRLAGKYNRYNPDRSCIKNFQTFLEGKEIEFKEINVALLNRFKAWLKGVKKSSDRSIVNHLIIIRTVFNQAIKGNLIDAKHYPFGKDKIAIRLPQSLKIGLTADEVKILENLELKKGSYTEHSRKLWLFSFYFAGMRVSDVLRLKWSDFQDERLAYKMGKNTKVGSLKASEKALRIIASYKLGKPDKEAVIFPELRGVDLTNNFETQRIISNAIKRIDKHLKKVAIAAKIEKELTMHIARHTFGNISGDKISVQMLQKLYRHSSITTTIGYQANFIHKDADDALASVIGV